MSAVEPACPTSLWRHRDYLLLSSGQVVSILGSRASGIALPLLVLALSHSPAQAGIVAALSTLPSLVLGLVAGALVDRWNRKTVMIAADAARAGLLASIPLALWAGHLTMFHLYVVALAGGSCAVFFSVAQLAALPGIVNEGQLPAALARNESIYFVSSLVGPSLGGFLYQIARAAPFLEDAVSYLASAVSLLFVKARFQPTRSPNRRPLRIEIGEGIAWLWRQPTLRTMALLGTGMNLVAGGSMLIVILLAKQQRASPAIIGGIFAIEAIGGILGAAVAPRLQRRLSFGQTMIGALWIEAALCPGIPSRQVSSPSG